MTPDFPQEVTASHREAIEGQLKKKEIRWNPSSAHHLSIQRKRKADDSTATGHGQKTIAGNSEALRSLAR